MRDSARDVREGLRMAIDGLRAVMEVAQQSGAQAFQHKDLQAVEEAQQRLRQLAGLEGELSQLLRRWEAVQDDSPSGTVPDERVVQPGTHPSEVTILGYQLTVNHDREAVLPGCGLRDAKFQRLARHADRRGYLQTGRRARWGEHREGIFAPDRSAFSSDRSWYRSAYRHLERALYRIAREDDLL